MIFLTKKLNELMEFVGSSIEMKVGRKTEF